MSILIKVPPNHYVHVVDQNLNLSRLVVGAKSFTTKTNESVLSDPKPFIVVPPDCYVTVLNPHARDEKGNPIFDKYGEIVLRLGREEVRFNCEPFPLYPGETLRGNGQPTPLPQVEANAAFLLTAKWDLVDADGVARTAGARWLYKGPASLRPQAGVEIVEKRSAVIIGVNQALRVAALYDCSDVEGKKRFAGEQWLIKTPGAYLLQECERQVGLINAEILTPTDALIVTALQQFTDSNGKLRTAGEQYLITMKDTDAFIPDVRERVETRTSLISLSKMQFCVVMNPRDAVSGRTLFGKQELRRGEQHFFLQPGESIPGGVRDVFVLGAEHCLSVRATETFDDAQANDKRRLAGQRWLVKGPCEYVPPLEARVEKLLRATLVFEPLGLYLLHQPMSFQQQTTPILAHSSSAQPNVAVSTSATASSRPRRTKR